MAEDKLTLTQFMDISRKTLVISVVVMMVIMIGNLAVQIYQAAIRPAYIHIGEQPGMGFGFLPVTRFPDSVVNPHSLSYALNFNGSSDSSLLPRFGVVNNIGTTNARVYRIPPSPHSLLADQRAREIAMTYGFPNNPQMIGGNIYRFSVHDGVLSKQLEINLRTFAITLTTDYLTNPDFIQGAGANKTLPDRTMAANIVREHLSRADLLPYDLNTAAANVNYVRAMGTRVERVNTFFEADFLEVNLPRAPLEGQFHFFGPNNQNSIYAIVARNHYGRDFVVYLRYFYRPLNLWDYETYPLRSTAEAWQIVQMGGAYIAQVGGGSQVVVNDVTLGYFEDPNDTDFLQPIFVFSAADGFRAFVPAIDPRVIEPSF